jgi:Kef-type K+ transport system membrane component KefB
VEVSVEPVQLAAVLAAVVLVASMLSVELGVTVALPELTLGVVVGNVFDLSSQGWLDFIAAFASIVLTFLAGMEVDPAYMRRRFEASVAIGVSSFAGPFVVASLVAFFLLDWTLKASLIAGTALSTTSLAVVYAVLVERGLTDVGIGKLLMSATFVTDLCTALALSAIFIKPSIWFPVFLIVSLALILALPRIAPWFFGRYGDRVIEPEIKLVFACPLLLMVLADASNGHAVLPAFVLGLVMSRHYQEHREEQKRLRVVAFAFLTPFFFIKGGLNVSLAAVFANLGLLAALLAAKMLPKVAHLPARAARGAPARDLHDPAHEHRPDLRDDLLALRPERGDHRRDPVLAPRHRRRRVCGSADRDCRALVPPRRRRREAPRPPQRRSTSRGVRLTAPRRSDTGAQGSRHRRLDPSGGLDDDCDERRETEQDAG